MPEKHELEESTPELINEFKQIKNIENPLEQANTFKEFLFSIEEITNEEEREEKTNCLKEYLELESRFSYDWEEDYLKIIFKTFLLNEDYDDILKLINLETLKYTFYVKIQSFLISDIKDNINNISNEFIYKFFKFSVGKYNPTNKRHLWLLNELDISEKDLPGLEMGF